MNPVLLGAVAALCFGCVASDGPARPEGDAARPVGFEYYGWFYTSHGPSDPGDLPVIATYTNTAFVVSPAQVPPLRDLGFRHVIYMLNVREVLARLWRAEGRPPPAPDALGQVWHERALPDYRERFFAAYRGYLLDVKGALLTAGAYADVDLFFLADEPALHTNVYLDQPFLDRHVEEFKALLPGKKCVMAFAADPTRSRPGAGPHFDPPAGLDLVAVQPWFPAREPGQPDVPCDRESIRGWLYESSPASTVGWAKRFDKPILVVGEARILGGRPPKDCWVAGTYEILRDDPSVHGLVWFVYNEDYTEADGYVRGAATHPPLVDLVRRLGERPATP